MTLTGSHSFGPWREDERLAHIRTVIAEFGRDVAAARLESILHEKLSRTRHPGPAAVVRRRVQVSRTLPWPASLRAWS